jgi:hypothetical protein
LFASQKEELMTDHGQAVFDAAVSLATGIEGHFRHTGGGKIWTFRTDTWVIICRSVLNKQEVQVWYRRQLVFKALGPPPGIEKFQRGPWEDALLKLA